MSASSKNRVKITKRFVENTTVDKSKRLALWDSEITGFNLRIYPTGRKVYYLQYRNSFNATKKVKIGVHGSISTEQAREQARSLSLSIASGEDPAEGLRRKDVAPTIAILSKEYTELHAKVNKRASSQYDDDKMISKIILPALGKKKIEEVTTHDIQKLHKNLADRPYTANRVRALLSKMFSLAIEWGWHYANPVTPVKKYQEHKRTRWLTEQEITRLRNVLDEYHRPAIATAIKLLLLTGSRKSEVLSATWSQFDLEKGVWTKPAHNTKQKRQEHVPLSSAALDLLVKWKKESTEEHLFPGRIPNQPIQDIKGAWATIRKRASLNDVRIHDLRHTYASHLVSKGTSLSIVGRLLGHTQTSTTQRYAHLADEPLREATNIFGNSLL